MLIKKNKKHKLQISLINQNNKPSCFVVDLKQQINKKQKNSKQEIKKILNIRIPGLIGLKKMNQMLKSGLFFLIKKSRLKWQRRKQKIETKPSKSPKPGFCFLFSSLFSRPLFRVLSFALVLFILILPFKAFTYYQSSGIGKLRSEIFEISKTGFKSLMSAVQSAGEMDFYQASNNFAIANNNFFKARQELENVNNTIFTLAKIVPNKKIRLAGYSKQILKSGELVASLGNNLSLGFNSLFENAETEAENRGRTSGILEVRPLFSASVSILDKLDNFINYANKAIEDAENLNLELSDIDSSILPDEYKDQFILLKQQSYNLEKIIKELVVIAEKAKIFLGTDQDKRYLLIFQNNTELRATGGFIGSFAVIDFHQGKIKDIKIPENGGYDVKNESTELISAPEPLHLVNPLWNFWDANWSPDWPTSAEKLMLFYEKSNNSKIDGVISFTPTVIEKLLSIIGPVDMTKDYGVIIDANNFWITVQAIAERKNLQLEDENKLKSINGKPKKIIGDLMNKIITELPGRLNKNVLIKLLELTEQSLSEKHILFYFKDPNLQTEIKNRGWDGRIKDTNLDYLSVINSNIAGAKTDKVVKEIIEHNSEIADDGSVINTVIIKRFHTGIKGQYFCGVRNVDWIRVYVPENSELLEATGFNKPDESYFKKSDANCGNDPSLEPERTAKIHEPSGTKIYNENNKTVFANWSMVDPEEKATIYLKYKLPFNLLSVKKNVSQNINQEEKPIYLYSFLAQKQSGSLGSEIKSNLKLSSGFKIIQYYPKDLPVLTNEWNINDKLNTDKYWAVVFEKNQNVKIKMQNDNAKFKMN